jgi:hypothetical protein
MGLGNEITISRLHAERVDYVGLYTKTLTKFYWGSHNQAKVNPIG